MIIVYPLRLWIILIPKLMQIPLLYVINLQTKVKFIGEEINPPIPQGI